MKRDSERIQRLADIGSTTALVAMTEINATKEGRAPGILARQVRAMYERIEAPEERAIAIESFCAEIEEYFLAPGVHVRNVKQERQRRGRTA